MIEGKKILPLRPRGGLFLCSSWFRACLVSSTLLPPCHGAKGRTQSVSLRGHGAARASVFCSPGRRSSDKCLTWSVVHHVHGRAPCTPSSSPLLLSSTRMACTHPTRGDFTPWSVREPSQVRTLGSRSLFGSCRSKF